MSLFLKLLALARVVFPLPNFTSKESVLAWWNGLGPDASEVIVAIASQINASGMALIELPGGMISIVRGADGKLAMSRPDAELLCAADPQAFGDGKFLEFLEKLLPILIQLLPLFLDANPTPAPEPAPAPDAV